MANVTTLVTKLFGPPEVIWPPRSFCPSLSRWTLIQNDHFKVSLDHFIGNHDVGSLDHYPKPCVSIGLAEADAAKVSAGKYRFRERGAWMVLLSTKKR